MKKGSAYNCPSCNRLHTIAMQEAPMVVCSNCGETIVDQEMKRPLPSHPPEDWSFIRIGTTGEYNRNPFIICGRIRLQLRNSYKNFWSAEYAGGKSFWIAESFGSFSVFSALWKKYERDVSQLRAGLSFAVDAQLTVKGDFVEKCEGMSYEGELTQWKLFEKGFFVVEGSRANGQTAFFTIAPKENVQYIHGEKISVDLLYLKNIQEWNEWK